MPEGKLLLSTAAIAPENTEILGIVQGICVLSRSIVTDMGAAFRNTTGGELKTYTVLLDQALNAARERLQKNAMDMGADGVFGINLACSNVATGTAEVVLIGTAFKFMS